MNAIDSPASAPSPNTASPAVPRRQFLATTALATSFSIVAPAAVFGAAANSKVTFGLIGVGGRGSWIADYLAKQGGFEILAIADYFQPVAESAGARFNVAKERRFSGLDAYKRLLAVKPDAVFLETPPYFFPIHAEAAVEAGCHVYMAKPVAVDVPGCLRILEAGRAATRKNQVFQVDFQTRADPWHIEGLKKVHDGMLGKVGLIQSFYHDDGFPDPAQEKTIEPLLHGLTWCNDNALGGASMVMQRNVQTFHRSITEGIHTNPTLEPSVNSTLASLLAREAALRQSSLTWAAFLQDKARLEPDLAGLKV